MPYATATYSVKDVGAPPATYRFFGQPLGFNATGQIVGDAYPASAPASSYQHCIAWTGFRYVDLIGPTSLNCWATSGISDANAKGVFETVGETYVPTNDQEVAFYAVITATVATTKTFPANSPSGLYAMNASGFAAGNAYYNPVGGFSYSSPPFVSSGTALSLLEPGCTTAVKYCMYYPYYYTGQSAESRSITADGTILGYAINTSNGQYVEYTGGIHSKAVQFSLPLDAGNGPFNIRGMDDVGDVVYEEYDPTSAKYLTWTYAPATKTARKLGVLSNNSCTQYVPLYVNGPGRVLGYTQSCSFASDATYWTWDSKNGMVAIAFPHTAFNSAYLYLINDKGQIAGDFTTTANVHHWGYLLPPSKL